MLHNSPRYFRFWKLTCFARHACIGLLFLGVAFGSVGLLAQEDAGKMKYPESKKVDHVDEYFGFKVPDTYQWLEGGARKSDDVAD